MFIKEAARFRHLVMFIIWWQDGFNHLFGDATFLKALSIPFGVGGQIYMRFPNEPANSH
jgi:hypothetical protein